jgi:hypothetical protein
MSGKSTSHKRQASAQASKSRNRDRVAVLETHVGERLIIRANPTQKAVRAFVKEQNRRWEASEAGGPSGLPPFRIHEANYYPSELEIDDPEKAVKIPLTKL